MSNLYLSNVLVLFQVRNMVAHAQKIGGADFVRIFFIMHLSEYTKSPNWSSRNMTHIINGIRKEEHSFKDAKSVLC